jgi:hypothetical protein
MQLKIYNAENASRKQTSTPMISLPKKGGLISINKAAAALLKLKEGDKISLAQDEKNVLDWYVFKDKAGIEIRLLKEETGTWGFNSTLISEDLRACAPIEIDQDKSIRMPFGEDAVVFQNDKTLYYPIITKKAK